MPKLLPAKKKLPRLPKEEKRLCLPQPGFHFWPFLALVLIPVLFVLLYAIYPWFTISGKVINIVIQALMIIFLIVLVFLIFVFLKFLYDLIKPYPQEIKKDKNLLTMTLLFLLSLMMVSTVIQLLQP